MTVKELIEQLKNFPDDSLEVNIDTFDTETTCEVRTEIQTIGFQNNKIVIFGKPL